jgi:hypothetical protein
MKIGSRELDLINCFSFQSILVMLVEQLVAVGGG